jgi:beta-glucosidase
MTMHWTPGDPGTLPDGRTRAALGAGFLWGTATAAYQIEGSWDVDGKGPSIWDTFAHTEGRIADGSTGDVACDHYARWPEDVALMADLGVNAYRFSVSWPRVVPTGAGAAEPRGLDFYERLVDGLLARGIAPVATLYHWDLPQPLEDSGGWLDRDTSQRFAEFAGHVADRLGDRVHTWITINEPVVVALIGYGLGLEAPGRALMFDAFPAIHHVLLGHGLAAQAIRAVVPGATVGITHNLSPVRPASDADADVLAARQLDALYNRTFVDPCLLGAYPTAAELGIDFDPACIHDGDLETIAQPLDVLGVNYYNPIVARAAEPGGLLAFDMVPMEGYEQTAMDWPVVPDGLRDLLVLLRDRYGPALPPVMVTENGAAFVDTLVDGQAPSVDDPRRVEYMRTHIAAVADAQAAGVDVRGYFVWSFMDNFEWAEGYRPRFGLVYVDYPTQRRIPKTSFAWYRSFLRPGA